MKTRKIRHRGAVKILSCSGMKIIRYSLVVLCVIMLGGCGSSKQEPASSQEQESSWDIYCKKYHVDPANPTDEQENYYLDCYVGSVEEERDMTGVVSFSFDSKNVSEVVRGVFLESTYYVVYTDSSLGFDHECIGVDVETANMVKTAIKSKHGQLRGYLVLDHARGVYNYNHELK